MFPIAYARVAFGVIVSLVITLGAVKAQEPKAPAPATDDERATLGRSLSFTEQLLTRKIDEQMLFQALADVAQCDKVRYTGPPPRVAKIPTAPGAKNPVVIPA